MDFSIIVRYLSGYDKKLQGISDKLDALAEMNGIRFQDTMCEMRALAERVETLGQANGTAYKQAQHCISELAKNQESVQSDLSDAMGTIRDATWAGC